MKKLSFYLGILAGFIIILTGILTALKITPPITLQGLEIGLGIWRILAGTVIIILVFASQKIYPKSLNFGIIIMGLFEIFVFYVEKDYTILFAGPFIAILAGTLGLINKK